MIRRSICCAREILRCPKRGSPPSCTFIQLQAATHQACTVFYANDTPIGYSVGHMISATDFLLDRTGILPAYRKRGLYTAFLRGFLPFLKAVGYERVEALNAPHDPAPLIPKLRTGFVIGGTVFDDEKGALVKMVHHTHTDRREAFFLTNNLPVAPMPTDTD